MQRQSAGSRRILRELQPDLVAVCHILRGVVLFASCALWIPALMAQTTPWGVTVVQTGITLNAPPVLAPGGDLYYVNSISQLVKVSATGQQVFSVSCACGALVWSPDGNIFSGYTKFSGVDGHVLYSILDVPAFSLLAGDSAGNAYVAVVSEDALGVEKFDRSGKMIYQSSFFGGLASVGSMAADAIGDVYVTGTAANSFVAVFDTQAGTQTYVLGNPNESGLSVGLDSAGSPVVLMLNTFYPTQSRVVKYDSTLSTMLFDTPVPGFSPSEMLVSYDGTAVLLGGTNSVNLPQLHPTSACSLPTEAPSVLNQIPFTQQSVMVRLDTAGNIVQSTFIPGDLGLGNGFAQPDEAGIAIADIVTQDVEVLTIGPAPEVQMGCVGNGASFVVGPLSPLEIVSIFGQNLGPTQAVSGQPGSGNVYPVELAGSEVTFDGIAAPLIFVSAGQINAVTPHELSGKTTTHVCVAVNGVSTNCVDAPVRPATPGIFLSEDQAALQPNTFAYSASEGYAAAVNQDGTINSQTNPAPVGSIVSIYATGLGTITPVLPDGSVIGLPLPSQDLQVSVSTVVGINQQTNSYVFGGATVLYAGPAPDEIEGLSQINVQVPPVGTLVVSLLGQSMLLGSLDIVSPIGVNIWTTGKRTRTVSYWELVDVNFIRAFRTSGKAASNPPSRNTALGSGTAANGVALRMSGRSTV